MTRFSAGFRTFFAECLASPADEAVVLRGRGRLRLACSELRAAGTAIEYLGALLVPEDELILHVFASAELDGVRRVSERAELHVERIVEAIAIGTRPNSEVLVPAPLDPVSGASPSIRVARRRR